MREGENYIRFRSGNFSFETPKGESRGVLSSLNTSIFSRRHNRWRFVFYSLLFITVAVLIYCMHRLLSDKHATDIRIPSKNITRKVTPPVFIGVKGLQLPDNIPATFVLRMLNTDITPLMPHGVLTPGTPVANNTALSAPVTDGNSPLLVKTPASSEITPVLQNARMLMMQNKPKDAVLLLNAYAPQDWKNYPDFYSVLADAYLQSGEPLLAATAYHQLLTLDPTNGVWWMGLGMSLEAMQKPAVAVEAYKKALDNDSAMDASLQTYISHRLQVLNGEQHGTA